MLMTFSKERYMQRILSGVKIHTIREDTRNRWKVGMTAHMWLHSPRNVSKNPYQFATATIAYIYSIQISEKNQTIKIGSEVIDAENVEDLTRIAVNDGFDSAADFFAWFGEFTGRLIFWKDLRGVEP